MLHWRSWLARGTYKNEKCRGREFDPPMEQIFCIFGLRFTDRKKDRARAPTVQMCAKIPLPGGLEPPTFRLTAERAAYCATEALISSSSNHHSNFHREIGTFSSKYENFMKHFRLEKYRSR